MIAIIGTRSAAAPLRAILATALLASVLVAFPPSAYAADPSFTFNGGGWGHGIGLSQYGARGYALQGKKYDWILAHYYQGTRLQATAAVTVRVNLDANAYARTSWRIQSGKETSLTVYDTDNSSAKAVFSPSTTAWITVSGGNTRVHRDKVDSTGKHVPGTIVKTFTGTASATSGGLIKIVGSSGPFNHSGVRWRGYLRFVPSGDTKSKAVNWVNIEQYLYGVVPRESPSSWPAEALKAQAVAARSYAYQDAKDGRTIYCTTMSQVYNGHSSSSNTSHEAASTNSAVDATKGKVVWYGSETVPVKTFFSSSTGGHTASIQDVWLASSPKPYYTGVTDADSDSNPNYRWTVGPLTSATVSSKIRAKDAGSSSSPQLDYSAPSPATIVSMALERASSGYTRYVTIRWSNGQSFKIKGDTMRSAMGLKSTKFLVKTTWPAPPTTSHQQTDSRLAWSGPWRTVTTSLASGGSYRYTSQYSSELVARFDGDGFVWVGNRGPGYGRARIAIDGNTVATVDQYSASNMKQQKLFTKTGLTDGTHTVSIKALASKNAKGSGYSMAVDRIDVVSGSLLQAPTPVSRYEESHPNVARLGGWMQSTNASLSGGSHVYNTRAGARVVLDFIGTRVAWIGTKGSSYGQAKVSVDGAPPTTVTLNATTSSHQNVLYSSPALNATQPHRIVIEVVGPTSGGAGAVSVDRLDVTGGWASKPQLAVVRIQEDDAALVRSGTWSSRAGARASGGTYAIAQSAGASMTVRFEGTSIAWIGQKAPSYGKADVVLDGVKVATVDLYRSSSALGQVLFTRSGLSAARHTLTIRVLGQRNPASTNTWVGVDAFDVAGQLAPL